MRNICLFLLLLCIPVGGFAQSDQMPTDEYIRAKIISVSQEKSDNFADIQRTSQDLELEIISGKESGKIITIENGIIDDRIDMKFSAGEGVILQHITKPDGSAIYLIRERFRLQALFLLTVLFFVLGVVLAGKTGFTSIIGLFASVLVLIFYLVPRIIAGDNPLIVSLISAMIIACTSLYLAHGFNRRTSVALVSTVITLSISVLMAVVFVHVGKLFGMGTEESIFLQSGVLEHVNLRGLLLGGIIIGALGVLDDITTAQTASIDELSKANHSLGFTQLYASGTSIGREHIASLINTLALAYIGASLPVFLLFYINNEMPWWVILNSEFLAEEIVRTLVGSSTLLLAVPISTWIAAKSFANGNHTNAKGCGHVH